MKKSEFENESDDPLWDLLGKAKPVEVSPFFSRNVLREVRNASGSGESTEGARFFSRARLRFRRIVLFAAAAFAVILVSTQVAIKDRSGVALYSIRPGDKEVISNLDDLLASDDSSSVWLDNSGYSD